MQGDTIRNPNHLQALGESLHNSWNNEKYTDVTICCGNRKLKCHRAVLALSSEWFKEMFSDPVCCQKHRTIILPDTDPDVMAMLLHYVYSGTITAMGSMLEKVAALGCALQFKCLMLKADEEKKEERRGGEEARQISVKSTEELTQEMKVEENPSSLIVDSPVPPIQNYLGQGIVDTQNTGLFLNIMSTIAQNARNAQQSGIMNRRAETASPPLLSPINLSAAALNKRKRSNSLDSPKKKRSSLDNDYNMPNSSQLNHLTLPLIPSLAHNPESRPFSSLSTIATSLSNATAEKFLAEMPSAMTMGLSHRPNSMGMGSSNSLGMSSNTVGMSSDSLGRPSGLPNPPVNIAGAAPHNASQAYKCHPSTACDVPSDSFGSAALKCQVAHPEHAQTVSPSKIELHSPEKSRSSSTNESTDHDLPAGNTSRPRDSSLPSDSPRHQASVCRTDLTLANLLERPFLTASVTRFDNSDFTLLDRINGSKSTVTRFDNSDLTLADRINNSNLTLVNDINNPTVTSVGSINSMNLGKGRDKLNQTSCSKIGDSLGAADVLISDDRVLTNDGGGRKTDRQTYSCLVCGKTFGQPYNLKRHVLTHTGDRPFQCPRCDYKASQNVHLEKHIRRIHNDYARGKLVKVWMKQTPTKARDNTASCQDNDVMSPRDGNCPKFFRPDQNNNKICGEGVNIREASRAFISTSTKLGFDCYVSSREDNGQSIERRFTCLDKNSSNIDHGTSKIDHNNNILAPVIRINNGIHLNMAMNPNIIMEV